MLSVDSWRTSMPPVGEAPPADTEVPAIGDDTPFITAVMPSMLALFDIGAPSTIIAVPRLFMSLPLTERRVMLWAELRSGLVMDAPGSRAIISRRELVWLWSMACLEMREAVDSPALDASATTCTSSRRKELAVSTKSLHTLCLSTTVVSTVSYPINCMLSS